MRVAVPTLDLRAGPWESHGGPSTLEAASRVLNAGGAPAVAQLPVVEEVSLVSSSSGLSDHCVRGFLIERWRHLNEAAEVAAYLY